MNIRATPLGVTSFEFREVRTHGFLDRRQRGERYIETAKLYSEASFLLKIQLYILYVYIYMYRLKTWMLLLLITKNICIL